jgi:hypothetical protein
MALSLWQYLLTPSDIDRKHDEDNVLIVNVSIGTMRLALTESLNVSSNYKKMTTFINQDELLLTQFYIVQEASLSIEAM